MTPLPYRLVGRQKETNDVTTLALTPVDDTPMVFQPGQFNMLSAFGVGEAAISMSRAPSGDGTLYHTVRDIGSVTRALCSARVGDLIGVRGPFGTSWGVDATAQRHEPRWPAPLVAADEDVVIVAGGIGLAPLRGAIDVLSAQRREGGGQVLVLVGARDPSQIIFGEDLERWSKLRTRVAVTVDASAPGWTGHVGLVTSLLGEASFDPLAATALVCGPEIMMRFTARALMDRGVPPDRIRISLERNMQCGLAWCGHCQLGPFLLCRDGPVLPYAGVVSQLLTQRER